MSISAVWQTRWRELTFGMNPRKTLARVCLWTISANIVFQACLLPITVSGHSMTPTYESGMRNFVNRLAYFRHSPERGDVVVIDLGARDGLIIKRIVALPGESVEIAQGRLLINGQQFHDAYADSTIPWSKEPVHLGLNEYFVIGDNRASSIFGRIGDSQILGKVVF